MGRVYCRDPYKKEREILKQATPKLLSPGEAKKIKPGIAIEAEGEVYVFIQEGDEIFTLFFNGKGQKRNCNYFPGSFLGKLNLSIYFGPEEKEKQLGELNIVKSPNGDMHIFLN